MLWLHVKLNYFKILSAFVDIHLKWFISVHGNLPEITSKLFQRIIAAQECFPTCSFHFLSHVTTISGCEIKHWNNFKIISKYFYFTCNHGLTGLDRVNHSHYDQTKKVINSGHCKCMCKACMVVPHVHCILKTPHISLGGC